MNDQAPTQGSAMNDFLLGQISSDVKHLVESMSSMERSIEELRADREKGHGDHEVRLSQLEQDRAAVKGGYRTLAVVVGGAVALVEALHLSVAHIFKIGN